MIRAARTGVLILAALAGGCINLGGGKPPARLLTLSAEATLPDGGTATAVPTAAIVVSEPETPRELAVPRIPVRIDDTAIAYLKGGEWSERPAALFRDLLAETLRAGHHLVLGEGDRGSAAAAHISGRLEAMGYDARTRSVVVRFDALRFAGGTLTSRRFEVVEANVAPDAAAVAPALNRAANSVARAVAGWVG